MARDAQSAEALSSAIKHKINYARDILNNDAYFERETASLRETIATLQRRLDCMLDIRENGRNYIDDWKKQLVDLNQERKLLANQAQIEKLLKAQGQLNELQAKTN